MVTIRPRIDVRREMIEWGYLKDQRDRIILEGYAAGLNVSEIAGLMGIGRYTVRRVIVAGGMHIRNNGRKHAK